MDVAYGLSGAHPDAAVTALGVFARLLVVLSFDVAADCVGLLGRGDRKLTTREALH